jgi:hypothetical protein
VPRTVTVSPGATCSADAAPEVLGPAGAAPPAWVSCASLDGVGVRSAGVRSAGVPPGVRDGVDVVPPSCSSGALGVSAAGPLDGGGEGCGWVGSLTASQSSRVGRVKL